MKKLYNYILIIAVLTLLGLHSIAMVYEIKIKTIRLEQIKSFDACNAEG